jgi:hypothetical protein
MNLKKELFMAILVLCFPLALLMKNTGQFLPRPAWKHGFLIVFAMFIAVLNLNKMTEFIYFNF